MMPPGPLLPDPGATWVDLSPFWRTLNAVKDENAQLLTYQNAAAFWESYEAKLTGSRDRIDALSQEMQLNGQWTRSSGFDAASTAFYNRMAAGRDSIQKWLDGGASRVRDRFRELAERLPNDSLVLDANSRWLLTRNKVVPGIGSDTPTPVTAGDGWVRIPNEEVDQVRSVVENAAQRHDELTVLFGQLQTELAGLPADSPWAGPTTTTAPPVQPATPGGGPAPAGPGGPGTGPGPGPSAAGPAAAGPGAAGPDAAGPGAGPDAAGPGTGPDAAATQSTSDMQVGPPEAAQPGAADLDAAAGGPTAGPGPELPPPDPSLAGVPTATAPPPGSSTSPLPSTVPTIPTGGNSNSAMSPLPVPGSPLPARFSSTARPGGEPFTAGPRSSTVDTPRGGAPVGTGSGASPVPRGGLVSSGSETGGRSGPGFFPPMMPPMYPAAGGNNGGIKPGEADFAGGPVRQVGGRDTWRAGLRPQLLGRSADHDDEPRHLPPEDPLPVSDVLDEELWRVPDAAPVTPPESRPPRGRSWGPA